MWSSLRSRKPNARLRVRAGVEFLSASELRGAASAQGQRFGEIPPRHAAAVQSCRTLSQGRGVAIPTFVRLARSSGSTEDITERMRFELNSQRGTRRPTTIRCTRRTTMRELMVDFITSLDGYASAEGWPGFWGLEGPEYLAWL